MHNQPASPRSLVGLDEEGASNHTFSIQSMIPSKDFTYQPLDYASHSPYAARTNDKFFSTTPKVPYGNLNDTTEAGSLPTITVVPNETKMATLSTMQPSEYNNTMEDRKHLVRHRRSEAKSWDLGQLKTGQNQLDSTEDADKQDSPAIKLNLVNNGPRTLGSSFKRIMEANRRNKAASTDFAIQEEGDEQDRSAGAGRRWKKVTLMMHTLTKLKTNLKPDKDDKDVELSAKQLELLSEPNSNLKPKPFLIRAKEKGTAPKILHQSISNNASPITATIYKRQWMKTPLNLLNRFLKYVRSRNSKILPEMVVRRKLKNKENKKLNAFREMLKTPVNPSAKWRLGWDVFLMFLVVVDMIILPLQISFSVLGSEAYQYITDIIFMVDILLSFHTAYYQNGGLCTDHKSIAKHYLKSWFWVDLISTLPLHAIEHSEPDDVDPMSFKKPTFLKLFRILRLIKVVRALRIFKLSKIFWKFKLFFGYSQAHSFFQLLKLAIVVMLVSHWLACIWHLVAVFELEFTNNETWLDRRQLLDADPDVRYINSLYWSVTTMLTVGYGDITPVSTAELWCSVFAMFFACGVFAYSLNTIGGIVNDLGQTKSKVSWKIYAINKFMQKNNLGKATQERVRGYMEHLLEEENTRKHDQEKFLELMPDHLRKDILVDLNGKLLTDNIIFSSNFTASFLQDLATRLQEKSLGPGEIIYAENDKTQDNCFYFITKGKVELFFIKTNHALRTLTAGNHFGEVAFFSGESRIVSASSRSSGYSQVFYLEKRAFMESLESYEREKESYCEIRDKVDLYNDYTPFGVKCFACGKGNHYAQYCPQLQYIPEPSYIVSIVRDGDKEFRSSFVRKNRIRFNALADIKDITEGTDQFREDVLIIPNTRLSRASSLTYKHKKSPENSSSEWGSPSGLAGEPQEDRIETDWKPDLPILEEEPIELDSKGFGLSHQRSRTIRFREVSQYTNEAGLRPEAGKSAMKKKKEIAEFEKVKIFSRYFIHNNVDHVISRINRHNQLKIAPQKKEERRRSTTDSLGISGALSRKDSKSRAVMGSLSILPGFFKREKHSAASSNQVICF